MYVQEEFMKKSAGKIKNLQHAIDSVFTTGNLEIHKITNFQPSKDTTPGNIKILQICSALVAHFNDITYQDNTHCISIVDNLIFDPNKKKPIPLTEHNLNSCCLGGDEWVFHHVSKTYEIISRFLPVS